MQIHVLDVEVNKKTPNMFLTERHVPVPNPSRGCFTRVHYPLVARAEPSMSIQEERNKDVMSNEKVPSLPLTRGSSWLSCQVLRAGHSCQENRW
jgi:hypothetical protein